MREPLKLVSSANPGSEDARALARVAGGDLGALGALYDRHARALLAFASRAVGSNEAEDVVQSTFIRAAKAASSYDGRAASARSWLFGIAARLVQERRRSFARFARALSRFDLSASSPPEAEDQSDMKKALLRLSEAKRVVLLLAEVEGFTCEEIATMLGVPIGTVWTRLHHARRDMRAFYEETSR